MLVHRLRYLLEREQEQYGAELAQRQPSVVERQDTLRDMARQLRERREQERMAIVQLKLEQQFRLIDQIPLGSNSSDQIPVGSNMVVIKYLSPVGSGGFSGEGGGGEGATVPRQSGFKRKQYVMTCKDADKGGKFVPPTRQQF